jgi:hypothetical protein
MKLGRMTSNQSLTWTCTNQITSWLMHNLSTFGFKKSHGQTQIHKTHDGLDLTEATTFPLIVYSMLGHETNTQMTFLFRGSQMGVSKFSKLGFPQLWGTFATLGAHSFVYKPLIVMRSQEKLWPLLRNFQRYVTHHLHGRKLGQLLTFNGWESNCQFDSQPFFWP